MAENEPAKPPTDRELRELAKIADQAVTNFKGGDGRSLQAALGMLFLGRRMGWKALLLMHDRKTVRKYERILGIDVREQFPAVGDRAHKSVAFVAAEKVKNFWKAVRGEIKDVKTDEIKG